MVGLRRGVIIINANKCVMCNTTIPEGKMICYNCETAEPSFGTTKIWVSLNQITDISKFVDLASRCKDDVVVKSGNFAVNAKSFMGLYSLDLSKPVMAEFFGYITNDVAEELKNFISE